MVGVVALEVVDVQARPGVVHKALEKFVGELGVKGTDAARVAVEMANLVVAMDELAEDPEDPEDD